MSAAAPTRADRLLEAVTAGRGVTWRGAPATGAALGGELAGVGIAGIALGILGLLVFGGFVALSPEPQGADAHVDPVAVGGFVVFVIALLALGPPLVLDALELRHTRYAVTRDGLVVVSGIVWLRATLVRPPFAKLERVPGTSGTILLGDADRARLDTSGQAGPSERLFTRLRGLGPTAEAALAALEALQTTSAPPASS